MTEEEKNKLKEKAFEIVKELKGTNNIFLPKNAELKGKLIAELESIVTFDIQEKVKKTLNRPILFVGDVYKSILAGCYAHCVRKVEFTMNLITKRLDEFSIKHFGNPVENFEMERQITKDLSEIEGKFIFKDCFGQPIEKLWYEDDPAYCHTSILNPNSNVYTQNTGIKNWLELYRLGATLFLVCLEGKDSNECKEFIKNIRDMNYPRPAFPNKLIVHTNDINKLPGYFPEPFKVIRLESSQNDIQIAKTPEKKIAKAFYDDAKGILFLNDKYYKLSKDERSLIELLKKYIHHNVAGIIEHFQDTKYSWKRGSFDTLVSRVNRKCRKRLGIEKLIMNEGRGSSEYCLSVEVEDRKFKMGVQKTLFCKIV